MKPETDVQTRKELIVNRNVKRNAEEGVASKLRRNVKLKMLQYFQVSQEVPFAT